MLPPGSYLIETTLLPAANIRIAGCAHQYGVMLSPVDDFPVVRIAVQKVALHDLAFDGSATAGTAALLEIGSGAASVRVSHCLFVGVGQFGIHGTGTGADLLIEECRLAGRGPAPSYYVPGTPTWSYGIYLDFQAGWGGALIKHNYFGNFTVCFRAYGLSGLTTLANISETALFGFYLQVAFDAHVGNYFEAIQPFGAQYVIDATAKRGT
jgi:hypothetical protein